MIGRLRGELIGTEGALVTVEVGGVGYEVLVPEVVLIQLPQAGEEVILLTRQIVREDSTTLYGFIESFQRRLFDLLLSVNGCGPKVALALLGQVGEDTIAATILAQDPKPLTRATGVGAKLAERIILELKNKIQEEALLRKIETTQVRPKRAEPADELVEALLALGYRRQEAEGAANTAKETGGNIQDQLKQALQLLKR